MTELSHELTRSVLICARRATVFRYFTDSDRFAAWWGDGSRIDARVGGEVHIRYPNGISVGGRVEELVPDRRIVFTYGYDSGQPIAAGSSRVAIDLTETDRGTLVQLSHHLPTVETRDAHVPGWRYQLAVFSRVVADEAHSDLAATIDGYFAAWSEADAGRRAEALATTVTDDVEFRDAHGCVLGREELAAHIAAVQMHMPGCGLERDDAPRQCQGTAIADWLIPGPDGKPAARGSNVFDLAPDGRIRRVIGLSNR